MRISPDMSSLLALAVATMALAVPAQAADGPSYDACLGVTPTIVATSGTVRGTPGDDVVVAGPGTTVLTGAGEDLVCTYGGTVKTGAGFDQVVLLDSGSPQHGRLELGRDGDILTGPARLLDLAQGGVVGAAGGFRVANVEHWQLSGGARIRVRGSDGPDDVYASACRVRMDGADGPDLLRADRPDDCPEPGTRPVAVIRGGAGDDTLQGTRRADVVLGGPGYDFANGDVGHDRCRAEEQYRCEG